ncbi:hypothetical protein ACJZTR_00345 [Neorickettsia risticii]|nr:hypothetical protein [Neorickettsia risticii]
MVEKHPAGNIQLTDKTGTKVDIPSASNIDQSSVSELSWDYSDVQPINDVSLESYIRGGNFTNTKIYDSPTSNQTAQSNYKTYMMERFLCDVKELSILSKTPLFSDTTEEECTPTESSSQIQETYEQPVCENPALKKYTSMVEYLPQQVDEHSLWSSVLVEQCGTTKNPTSVPNIERGPGL